MRYILIFLGATIFILVAAVVLAQNLPHTQNPRFSVAFSAQQARYLGLEANEVYGAILKDFKPAHIRLQANWNDIEPIPGEFDFTEIDNFIAAARKNGTTITLAIGRKLPRWPECHDPVWLKNLKPWEVQSRVNKMLVAVVEHYHDNKTIVRWQLENEPLFNFGACPVPSWHNLRLERDLLKALDPSRPILLTDSGELSSWLETALLGGEQGATLYRVTWDPMVGYFRYLWPPFYYRLKAALVSPFVKQTIVSELQMEPWAQAGLVNAPVQETERSFNLERFNDNVSFFKRTGLPEAFLWGVEWWYASLKKGDSSYWRAGQDLFNQPTI
jgi:hypothetical protein